MRKISINPPSYDLRSTHTAFLGIWEATINTTDCATQRYDIGSRRDMRIGPPIHIKYLTRTRQLTHLDELIVHLQTSAQIARLLT
jgi:hypothetical protein